jgi:hypothetical protein
MKFKRGSASSTTLTIFLTSVLCAQAQFGFAQGSTNRSKKVVSIVGQGGYSIEGAMPVAGGEISFNLGKKFDLSLGGNYWFSSSKPQTSNAEFKAATDAGKSTIFTGYGLLRWYLLDSFNLAGGGFFRSSTNKIDSVQATRTYAYEEKGTSIGALAAIGNKWVSKGGFVFGVDWVQYEYVAQFTGETSGSTKLNTGGTISPTLQDADTADSIKASETNAELAGIHVGVLKFGFSF